MERLPRPLEPIHQKPPAIYVENIIINAINETSVGEPRDSCSLLVSVSQNITGALVEFITYIVHYSMAIDPLLLETGDHQSGACEWVRPRLRAEAGPD
jgi:hypothetical protein